ncbi:MAG TPA: alpha/beta hydrolase [Candidatus Acidoferrales bacterium]|nr:alpha/beta hydrolase [Candidatus Acidoferrales bacterium]
MGTFVLVHGSWHDGSAWDPIVRYLESRGHRAFAPTVAGHGKSASRNVSHADCTKSITRFIVDHSLSDVILLGHSFAGTIISKVVEAIPERIRRLIFQNAFVLRDGHALMDESPPHYVTLFDQLSKESKGESIMIPFAIWRESFINDADLETARWTYAQLSPEPYRPSRDKLDLKKFYSLDTPRSYIHCTEDIALPPGEWGWHPRMSSRLGLCRLVQMPGSHEVMYTNPAGLAEKILEAGRD